MASESISSIWVDCKTKKGDQANNSLACIKHSVTVHGERVQFIEGRHGEISVLAARLAVASKGADVQAVQVQSAYLRFGGE